MIGTVLALAGITTVLHFQDSKERCRQLESETVFSGSYHLIGEFAWLHLSSTCAHFSQQLTNEAASL